MDALCDSGGMFAGAKEVGLVCEIATGTIDVSLCQYSKYGIHCSVFGCYLGLVACDGHVDGLSNANLFDIGIGTECLFYILHLRTATGEDDATQQFVAVFVGYLIQYIGDNLFYATFDNLDKLTAFYLTVTVDGIFLLIVDFIGISKG